MPKSRTEYQRKYQSAYKTRSRRVGAVISDAQYTMLADEAKRFNVPVQAVIRARLTGEPLNAGGRASRPEAAAKEIVFLLRNIANNIHQMAFHSDMLRGILDAHEPLLALGRVESDAKKLAFENKAAAEPILAMLHTISANVNSMAHQANTMREVININEPLTAIQRVESEFNTIKQKYER